jgi:peptide/nickel transport system substrate-binding protein
VTRVIAQQIQEQGYLPQRRRGIDALTNAFKLRSTPHPYRKPIATELIFRQIPDISQQIAGMRTGDIDKTNFTSDQADQLKKSGINVISKLTEMNLAPFGQPEMKLRNTPLQDKRVRLALNYAVNKEVLAREFYKGFAEPSGQFGYPDNPLYNPDLKPFPYDPAMAKKLLADAGYPNGFKLEGGLNWTPQTANQEVVLAVLSDWKAVGVKIEAKSIDYAAYLDRFYGNKEKGDVIFTRMETRRRSPQASAPSTPATVRGSRSTGAIRTS